MNTLLHFIAHKWFSLGGTALSTLVAQTAIPENWNMLERVGSLAIVGWVVYFVFTRMEGSLNRLSASVDESNRVNEQKAQATQDLIGKIEELIGEVRK